MKEKQANHIKVSKGFMESQLRKNASVNADDDTHITFNKKQLAQVKLLREKKRVERKKDLRRHRRKEELEREFKRKANRIAGSTLVGNLEGGEEINDAFYVTYGTIKVGSTAVKMLQPTVKSKVNEKLYVKKIADKNRKLASSSNNKSYNNKDYHSNYNNEIRESEKISISNSFTKTSTTTDTKGMNSTSKNVSTNSSNLEFKKSSIEYKRRVATYAANKLTTNNKSKDSILKLIKDFVVDKAKVIVVGTIIKSMSWVLSQFLFIALAVLPFFLVIGYLVSSPFALLFPTPAKEGEVSAQEYLYDLEEEFLINIDSEIINTSDSNSKTETEVIYMSLEGDSMVSNYYDVLATYSTKYNKGDLALVMKDDYPEKFRDIYEKMNFYEINEIEEIDYFDVEETFIHPETGEKTIEIVQEEFTTTFRTIYVYKKTYTDLIYNEFFDSDENKIITELMQPKYLLAMQQASGELISGLTEGEVIKINKGLIPGEKGSEAIKIAMEKVGAIYSQAYRYGDNYYDCSSLTARIYKEIGVNLTYKGTDVASYQAMKMVEEDKVIDYSDLAPGDLIFWANNKNDRYLSITHVGFYAGNGMTIEASYSRGQVVYRSIWGIKEIVLCARPY